MTTAHTTNKMGKNLLVFKNKLTKKNVTNVKDYL